MKNYIFVLFVLLSYQLLSQDQSWKLYDDESLARVDVTIDPQILIWIYQNVQSDSEHCATFRFRNGFIDETLDSIGFRLRGNTSRVSKKKSFKISFNSFIKGREFYGVDKLNLNGEHNDPSIIRSKLCFDLYKDMGYNASRANHVRVYINDKYYGLYISVEHIDDEFLSKNFSDGTGNLWKCLYPADLKYLGADPNIYKNLTNEGKPVYELTTNEEIGDFSKLARFIDVLNNTPLNILKDSLQLYINITEVLKYLAFNVLSGGWDSYWSLMNNYYLYYHPAEERLRLIPYDYDNTMGIDWSGKNWTNADPYNFPKVTSGIRPLAERVLAIDQFRDLYTHFLDYYSDKLYDLSLWENRINNIKDIITTAAIEDTFRTKDWGFSIDDFHNSYSAASYQNQHVKYGLKQFVNLRNSTLNSQLNYKNAQPSVYNFSYSPKNPNGNDTIVFEVSAYGFLGLANVKINYSYSGSSDIYTVNMSYSPISNSKKVDESDRWIGKIPPLGEGKEIKVVFSAEDVQGRVEYYPSVKPIIIRTNQIVASSIVINEILADNSSYPDPAGEKDDWIELYNPTSSAVMLTGKYLSDKKDNIKKWKFEIPNLLLNPGEFLVVWCDENPGQPGIHTNFKLSAGGEFISLTAEDGVSVMDSLTFGPQTKDIAFARVPDGNANWVFQTPTLGFSNSPSSVGEELVLTDYSVAAYPNPFNPITRIKYEVSGHDLITMEIFNILGSKVWENKVEVEKAGKYEELWNGRDSRGNVLASGIYILKVRGEKKQYNSLKLVLMK